MGDNVDTKERITEMPPPSATSPLANEAYVLMHGITGAGSTFKQAAGSAWEHPGEAAAKILLTSAVSFGIGALSSRAGAIGLAGKALACAAGVSFVTDASAPILESARMATHARSQGELDLASAMLSRGLGDFAFDTLLTTPGAVGGAFVGAHLSGRALLKGKLAAASALEAATPLKLSDEPYRFRVYSPKYNGQPRFDFGVEVTEARFLRGQPNLDHHGPTATWKDLSASEQALRLKPNEMPEPGAVLATTRVDADSAVAMAVLANRRAGRAINPEVVSYVGGRDRGIAPAQPAVGIENEVRAIDQLLLEVKAKQGGREKLPKVVAELQQVLDGTLDRAKLLDLADMRRRSMENGVNRLIANGEFREILPGKLLQISYDKAVAMANGQEIAPVVVFHNTYADRVTVAARPESPHSRYIGRALAELSAREPGWSGRDNIFGNQTRMPLEEVSRIVARYVDPPLTKRLAWAAGDRLTALQAVNVNWIGEIKSLAAVRPTLAALKTVVPSTFSGLFLERRLVAAPF